MTMVLSLKKCATLLSIYKLVFKNVKIKRNRYSIHKPYKNSHHHTNIGQQGDVKMTAFTSRIPCAPEYKYALGQAVYNFTYLEWGAIYVISRLQPNYFKTNPSQKTSGEIFKDLKVAVKDTQILGPHIKTRVECFAEQFGILKDRRNSLLHAHPYTADGGEQRLMRRGKDGALSWSIEELDLAARDFETLAVEAGELLHGPLSEPICQIPNTCPE
jgi:hypothetical protein